MDWKIEFHDEFEVEFDELSDAVQNLAYTKIHLLAEFGPSLKRPHAATLNGSKHANMEELR